LKKYSQQHSKAFRALVLFLLILAPFKFIVSQSNLNQKSLLWEITGKGTKKPSYLYGTMHVSGKLAFYLSDSFFISLKNCDYVALEINPDYMLADMVNSKFMKSIMSGSRNLYNNANSKFYENSFFTKEITNSNIAYFLSQKSQVANSLLYRSNLSEVNKEEDTYLDLFIFQTSRKLGKQVIGLETFEGSMDMYVKSVKAQTDEPDEEKNSTQFKGNVVEKLEEAYRRGDLVMIDSLSKSSETKSSHKFMIVERNKVMLNGMDSIIQTGATLFTGVGAAHLGGEEGILKMLIAKGYTVKPVSWHGIKQSKYKAQAEKLVLPTVLTKHYNLDSTFSVLVPTKLQSLEGVSNEDIYLSTDMTNGSYFMISAASHNGFIKNHNKEYFAKKIDSLIYENIAGKIILKKETVTEDGDICFTITSKTRRSDIEKYKIIITPFRIFLFKVAGNGDYANGKDATQFIESAKLYKHNKPKHNNEFSYEFNQKNVYYANRTDNDNSIKHLAVSDNGLKYNLVLVQMNTEPRYIEQDTFEYNYIIEKVAEKNNFTVKNIKIDTNTFSASFELEKEKEVTNGKLVVNGPYYYFLLDNSGDLSFLNSFKLINKPKIEKFIEHIDTSLWFKVKLVEAPEKSDYLKLMNGTYSKKELKEDDYEYKNEIEFFDSKVTGEKIRLNYDKYHKYFSYANIDSLWDSEIRTGDEIKDPIITNKVFSKKDGANILEYNVEAIRNNNKYIRVKMIQKGRYLYTLNAMCQKGIKSAFIDTFYNTFSLLDSNYGLPITESKVSLLLTNIFSADSAIKAGARASVYKLGLQVKNKDFKELTQAIKKAGETEFEIEKHTTLIEALSKIKTTESINWLKQYYFSVKDTPAFMFGVLFALVDQNTLPAAQAFAELVKKETPIDEESYGFNVCINQLCDSLEIAAKVAPQLMFLLEFDEYKERIITMLAQLKYENLIDPVLYTSNKSKLISTANIELKKHIASIQNDEDNNSSDSYNNYDEDEDEAGYDSDFLNVDKEFKSASNSIVFDYAVLLTPFYNEPVVKQFFDKILKNGEEALQVSVGALLLKNNIAVDESNWEKWASKNTTRIATYKLLHNLSKTNKFPSKYKSIDSFARAELFNYEPKPKDNQNDSIIFVLKDTIKTKIGVGTLIVYKKRNTEDKNWKWTYIVLEDKGDFKLYFNSSNSFTNEYNDIKDEEFIKKIKTNVRLVGRNKTDAVSYFDNTNYKEE
jgi:uncharacterized protein YbaP (TraB family)